MFRYLRVKARPEEITPEVGALSVGWLARDASQTITIQQINALPDNVKRRIFRALLPPQVLTQFKIDPLTWTGPQGNDYVRLKAIPETGVANIAVRSSPDATDDFLCVEIADNAYNGLELNLILLNDPHSPRFETDYDGDGRPTLFGTLRRNLEEEERAMCAGLAPGQVRSGLGASRQVMDLLDSFSGVLGQRAYFLEPLTYVSAWIFERRGFAYVRGHRLMDDIHKEFQPGGRLFTSLDGSSPFRRLDQWRTVRGRAWAIHDGILEKIGEKWDALRMVKQVGRHSGVETFPEAIY